MKKAMSVKKGFFSALSLVLALCLVAAFALPAKAAERTYTIRLFAGKEGSIDGKTMTQIKVKPGTRVNLNTDLSYAKAAAKDSSIYSVDGVRESGKDSNEALSNLSFTATKDQDYVVCYCAPGDQVAYTVNYQTSSGTQLAPSDTFYGKVGEKAVAAYVYVDGYQPDAYNHSRTLVADASKNVFTFTYTQVNNTTTTTTTTTNTTTNTTVQNNGTTTNNTNNTAANNNANNGNAAAGNNAAATDNTANADNNAAADNNATTEQEDNTPAANQEPYENIDEDDGTTTPEGQKTLEDGSDVSETAETEDSENTADTESGILSVKTRVLIGAAVALAVAAIAAGVVVFNKRRES